MRSAMQVTTLHQVLQPFLIILQLDNRDYMSKQNDVPHVLLSDLGSRYV